MSNQGADVTVPVATEDPRWSRISEGEARAAAGDEAVDRLLAEVEVKGRASTESYRASGHTVVDQTSSDVDLNWRAVRVTGEHRSAHLWRAVSY